MVRELIPPSASRSGQAPAPLESPADLAARRDRQAQEQEERRSARAELEEEETRLERERARLESEIERLLSRDPEEFVIRFLQSEGE